MARLGLMTGAFFGLLSVVMGAFGSHFLTAVLSPKMLYNFETGVRYMTYHALLLLLIAIMLQMRPSRVLWVSFWLTASGMTVFSGSLIILSLSGIKALGAMTPIGGLMLIGAWASLMISAWQRQ